MGNNKSKSDLHSSSDSIPTRTKSPSVPSLSPRSSPPIPSPSPQEPPAPPKKLEKPSNKVDSSKPDDFTFHLVIIGGKGVGKTSLLHRFTSNTFSGDIKPTEGVDFLTKSIMVGPKKVGLEIWDTSGEERTRVPTSFYQGANGVVAVYDVTSRESFEEVRKWLDDGEKLSGSHPVRFLVGNKSDQNRVVPAKEGEEFAKNLGLVFLETSAKTDHNVGELFQTIGTAIQTKK